MCVPACLPSSSLHATRNGRRQRRRQRAHPAGRTVPVRYPDTDTGFPDGFPFLLASTASLYDLNLRLASPVDMRRFRYGR